MPARTARSGPAPLVALVAALGAVALLLGGCSGQAPAPAVSGTSTAPSPTPARSTPPDPTAPIVVSHRFGLTTLAQRPERIAALGEGAADAVLALGAVPVLMPRAAYGGDEDGLLPWQAERVADLSIGSDDVVPALFPPSVGLPLGQLRAARPDVILAVQSALTLEQYQELSTIAPVVAPPGEGSSTSWQLQTQLVGAAMAVGAQSRTLVAQVEERLSTTGRQAHLEDRSARFALSDGSGRVLLADPASPRAQLLADLGLAAPTTATAGTPAGPGSDPLADPLADPGSGTTAVAAGDLAELQADVLVVAYTSPEARRALEADPAFADLPVVARGGYVPLDDAALLAAAASPSVLSLPWSAERLVGPLISATDDLPDPLPAG